MKVISVYDGNTRKRLCYLQNAHNIKYTKNNGLWVGEFALPYSDPKNKYCISMNHVELWDVDDIGNDRYIGLFRIMPSISDSSGQDDRITYTLEHVLATLLDDTMHEWHEIGNLGVYTRTVINYILDHQLTKRWILGECDYAHQYLYGWQDENLLSGLFSVTNAFAEDDYQWVFNTKKYPWTINLKKITDKPVTDIRYKKNIHGIHKTEDPTNLTTRLYCYGYGESDNRLNIKKINNGLPYIDSPNISKYGIITRYWKDERFTVEESLLQSGKAMLKALEEPIVSYEVDILTIRKANILEPGDMVRVIDNGIDFNTRVLEVRKDDVSGEPYSGTVILANKSTDIAQSIADMADRQRIATTYSQGAETLFADSLYDNADPSNPAELTFTIPYNAVHINEILLNARVSSFRAYSRATRGGGASSQTTNAGGSSNQTSSSGGGSNQTSSSGGGTQTSTSAGGGTQTTSGSGGGSNETSSATPLPSSNISDDSMGGQNAANHNHGIARGLWVCLSNGGTTPTMTAAWEPSGAHSHGAHSHSVSIPSHTHSVSMPTHSHSVTINAHTHSVSIPAHQHSVSIPAHQHSVSIPAHQHNFTLPDHIHDIEYGIYSGPRATTMIIYIDNVLIGTYSNSVDNINLISYMSKNANGEVLRGRHTIKIVPNSLTRIECAIQIRLFTNARGAGQY